MTEEDERLFDDGMSDDFLPAEGAAGRFTSTSVSM